MPTTLIGDLYVGKHKRSLEVLTHLCAGTRNCHMAVPELAWFDGKVVEIVDSRDLGDPDKMFFEGQHWHHGVYLYVTETSYVLLLFPFTPDQTFTAYTYKTPIPMADEIVRNFINHLGKPFGLHIMSIA